jgi:hypothetical protein
MQSLPQKHRTAGYSLIELAAVVAIMITLLAFLAPALGNLGRAHALTTEGNRLDLLIGLARQNSLSKNALTALVMNTEPASPGNLRSFSLWELRRGTGSNVWAQLTRWETFRDGIAVYQPDYTGWENPDAVNATFPAMSAGGVEIASYQYRIFQPTGNLWGENPLQIRLVEGASNAASNIFDITILPGSGKTKISRN